MSDGADRKIFFIFVSLIFHILFFFLLGHILRLPNPFRSVKKQERRVVYVKILDVPKPEKEEIPKERNTPIISQYTMRKKGPLGKQEKSMVSGSAPVLKPQWGAPLAFGGSVGVKQAKGTSSGKSGESKNKSKKGQESEKNKRGQRVAKKSGITQKKRDQEKKGKTTRVKIGEKIVKVPLPPVPKRKIPLIDPRLLSKESRKIVPQMGEGESVEISLDTTASKYISYFKHIRDKIYLVWRYPPEAAAVGISGVVRILFVIERDGSLKEVKVLNSSGYSILDKAAVKAIIAASPFPPFPSDWTEKELRIRASFRYILYSRSPF